eukprot:g5751.t1
MKIVAIFLLFLGACIFGLYTSPVKKFSVYDGVVYNWFFACGALLFSTSYWIFPIPEDSIFFQGDGTSTFAHQFFESGLLGGGLWAFSNLLTSSIIVKTLGYGRGFFICTVGNNSVAYICSRFGFFGLHKAGDIVSDSGMLFLSVGILSYMLVERHEFGNKDSKLLEANDDCEKNEMETKRSSKLIEMDRNSANLPFLSMMLSTGENVSECLGNDNDNTIYSESTEVYNALENGQVSLPCEKKKKVFIGLFACLLFAVSNGCSLIPMTLWQQENFHRHQTNDSLGGNASSLPFIFSHTLGVWVTSTWVLVLYYVYRRTTKPSGSSSLKLDVVWIIPAIFCGFVWNIGTFSQFFSVSYFGLIPSYPVQNIGAILVSTFFSLVYFGEAPGLRNRLIIIFAVTMMVIGVGSIPTVEIAPGVDLPMAGLGTWLYNNTRAGNAVAMALELGYTHIDTANDYDNSVGIGKAIKESGRARDSFFITSKVPGGLSFQNTTLAHNENLEQLQVDYVDLLLIHFPTTMAAKPVGSKKMRQEQWRAMEALVLAGKARAIGVSHFCERHLLDILEIATIRPAVNQVQYHVGMGPSTNNANDFKAFDEKTGVLFESFSPLCGPCMVGNSTTEHDTSLINGKVVTSIGAKYGKTGAQVSLKWLVQQGIPVIPKTDTKEHLLENMDLFDWQLSAEDMKTLTQLKTPAVAGAGGNPPVSGDCTLP